MENHLVGVNELMHQKCSGGAQGVSSALQHIPSMPEALDWVPGTPSQNKKALSILTLKHNAS
jgi:hypothetical protein